MAVGHAGWEACIQERWPLKTQQTGVLNFPFCHIVVNFERTRL